MNGSIMACDNTPTDSTKIVNKLISQEENVTFRPDDDRAGYQV